MKHRVLLFLPVSLLILIEQAIKIFIFHNLMNREFDLVGNILGFKPYINVKYSWINSMGDFGIGLPTHIIFNVIVLLFVFVIYCFVREKYGVNRYENYLFTFLLAGIICSLLDKIVWGGSLDYIWLKGFFVFDLKDLYLSIFEGMLVFGIILNYRELRKLNEKVIIKDFTTYLKGKLIRNRR